MATQEIAEGLVSLCKQGHLEEAMTRYYHQDIVSVEAGGDPAEVQGMEAVQAKAQWWAENHEIHGMAVEGPWRNGDQFVARFTVDMTFKPTGERHTLDEMALYTVEGDKIVQERFFYNQ